MRVQNEEKCTPSYPAYGTVRGLVIGTSLTAALALVSCGKPPKEGADNTGRPAVMKVKRVHLKGDIAPVMKPADSDHDGVIDSLDKCPNLKGSPAHDGCPAPRPPVVTGGVAPRRVQPPPPMPPNRGGTTQVPRIEVDSDGDGVPDTRDRCVSDRGPASNQGCPIPRKRLLGKPAPRPLPMGGPKTPNLP